MSNQSGGRGIDSFTHAASDRVLTVEVINHYGRVTVIPRCDLSRAFAALLGQKNLTLGNVESIKLLGYVIRTEGREL